MSPVITSAPPRIRLEPVYHSSAGDEAVDLARMAGLELDDWQADVLRASMGERADRKWAAFEVGLMVSRQNGKGSILEARELAGLFLIEDERLIIHSAHESATAVEAFRRLLFLVEETPELAREVKRISNSRGDEGIELRNGKRIRFRTRTKGGGRGFSSDLLILDEAMILPTAAHGALMPTLSARPNPQVWYTGSAVDQEIHDHGVVWARIRERGHAAREGDSLAYFEWSMDPRQSEDDVMPGPSEIPYTLLSDEEGWAQANPSLGIRISAEHVRHELASMDPRTFAVERLGIGDWPATNPDDNAAIDLTKWRALADPSSKVVDGHAFTFDVSPDRSSASISVAGRREDGLIHVETVDRRAGTGWVAPRLAELSKRYGVAEVQCDGASPAAALREAIEAAGVTVVTLSSADYVQACGIFYDQVEQGGLRHLGAPEMESAIRGAAVRPLVDSWAWSRKSSKVDITPLVAATLALWRAGQRPRGGYVL